MRTGALFCAFFEDKTATKHDVERWQIEFLFMSFDGNNGEGEQGYGNVEQRLGSGFEGGI